MNTLILDSVGSNTQIHLRDASTGPAADLDHAHDHLPGAGDQRDWQPTGAVIWRRRRQPAAPRRQPSRPDSRRPSPRTVSPPPTSVTGNKAQTLTSISGLFSAGHESRRATADGPAAPDTTPCPAGHHLQGQTITGSTTSPVNLLTDPKIFGYDPMTGQLIRFNLNLTTNTGTIDPTFPPISVPGHRRRGSESRHRTAVSSTCWSARERPSMPTTRPRGRPWARSRRPSRSIPSRRPTPPSCWAATRPTSSQMIDLTASLADRTSSAGGRRQPLTLPQGFTLWAV